MKTKRKGKHIYQPNTGKKKWKASVVSPQTDIVSFPLADHVDPTTSEPPSNINTTVVCDPENRDEKATHLSGFIFMCNRNTKLECYRYRVFGLPSVKKEVGEEIKPGAKLFLFDFELKLLYGIYEATSTGKLDLEPAAFNGRFPMQVKFKILRDCFPLPEDSLKRIIRENYTGSKFKQELSSKQVEILLSSFRPLTSSSSRPTHLIAADTPYRRMLPSVGPRYDPKANVLAYGHSGASGHAEHVNPAVDFQNLVTLCTYYVNAAKSQQPAGPEGVANGMQETSYSRTTEAIPPHDQITSLEMRYRNREPSAPQDHLTNPPVVCYPTVDGTNPHDHQVTNFEMQYYQQPPVQPDSAVAAYQESMAPCNPAAPYLYPPPPPAVAVQPQAHAPYQPIVQPQWGPQYQDPAVAYNQYPAAQPTHYGAPPVMYHQDGYYAAAAYAPSTTPQPQTEISQAGAPAAPVYPYYSYGTTS